MPADIDKSAAPPKPRSVFDGHARDRPTYLFDLCLASKGRRLVGWDEILEGGLAPDATVMSWRGTEGGIAAAKAGHDVVMAPTSHTYLDYYQEAPEIEPLAIGGFLPLETVYSFEPVPFELDSEQAKHILGVQGQLWSEFLPNIRHLEYMAWPRLAAIAEVGWSRTKNEANFLLKIPALFQRLYALGVNYRPSESRRHLPIGNWRPDETGQEWTVRDWELTKIPEEAGEYLVRFAYTHGAVGLSMPSIELLEDGVVVASDSHEGFAGWNNRENTFRLRVPGWKKEAQYRLRAKVRADGPDSSGEIYITRVGKKE